MFKKLIIFLLVILISGCSYNEISDLAIISSIGIDKVNNNYEITATTNSKVDSKIILTNTSSNIKTAISILNNDISKKIYLDHLKLVVLNTDLNENDLKNIMNYFIKLDNDFYIYFTNDKSSNIISNLINKNIINNYNDLKIKNNINSFKYFYNSYLNSSYFVTNSISIDNKLNYNNITIYKDNILINNIKPYIYHLLTNNIIKFNYEYKCDNNSLLTISNIKYINNKISATYKKNDNNCYIDNNNLINNLNKELNETYNLLVNNNIKINKFTFNKLKEDNYE